MAVPRGGHGGFDLFPENQGWGRSQYSALDATVCALFYAAIIAIFLMVIALIVKLLRGIDGDDSHGAGATERTRLMPPKEEIPYTWYNKSDEDLESGKGTSSPTSSSSSSPSSDDLYDGKICVICYDDQRSCFFIPCGHCVTCHACADRIVSEENKSCPICRTIINNVMKLHLL